MDNKINELLKGSIITELESLDDLKSGSEERKQAISDLVKLHSLRMEELKFEREIVGEEIKSKQLDEQTKERYLKLCIDILGVTLPLAFYASWMRKGFKFEETGVYTSATFKGLINRFRTNK